MLFRKIYIQKLTDLHLQYISCIAVSGKNLSASTSYNINAMDTSVQTSWEAWQKLHNTVINIYLVTVVELLKYIYGFKHSS